ncbi:anthranilate synthase component I family protein [Candidatus Daviesbacteria bacterium]|nr:anthranilate synthase component I family protein [Candidatus Daviesbacteria bacterium]
MNKLPKIKISKKPTYLKFAEDIDFYELFAKIEQQFDTCFIFESLGEEGKFSRYSIIGFDPPSIISARRNNLKIDNKIYSVKNPLDSKDRKDFNPYLALREILPPQTITRNYAGGLIGYLSYEAINLFGNSLKVKEHKLFPLFKFGVYLDGIVLDKLTNELYYFYYDKNRLEEIKRIIRKPLKKRSLKVKFLRDTLSKEQHQKIVNLVKEEIIAGNTFQCEVGFKSEFEIEGDYLEIYRRLRKVNPSPFMYYLKFGNQIIIGASPELLLRLKDGDMETFPLAGTIKRGQTENEDALFARQLLNDPKEIAEHNMLVDLSRNDLGRVGKFGTVKVRSLMDIKKFSHVAHISSEITGIIKDDEDMFSALISSFPMGTVTGTPKIETIKIIDRNEPDARGPYGGAVGHFGFNGDCTFALPLRSLFISGNYAYVQTCSGIVYDSSAEKEFDEVQRKLQAMKEVLK